ncbi:MAG: glutamate 5-kinase [Actinomycetota bacterium]|nr:glutamate 5-kinase [Actinomycetota bacterium]
MTGRATDRPRDVRRLVVKVGSSSLVDDRGHVSKRKLGAIVRQLAEVAEGRQVVLVSSGAIASGLGPLGWGRRPRDMPGLQAAAAVGQGRLMSEYARLFHARELVAAQVLLTQEDFLRRRQFVNARQTLERLLDARAIPVVNENDTVATAEITVGDNDRLAALVAAMVGADLLVLLSDVDGIYTRDPRRGEARLLDVVTDPTTVRATGPGSAAARGGMATKLEAALVATAAGVGVVVAGARRRDVLRRVLEGERVGTWLPPRGRRQRGRKVWIGSASGVRGTVAVDAGAERAVRDDGRSLLAAGVTEVRGDFAAGDAVDVVGPSGTFARGIANYSSRELMRIAGRSKRELTAMRGGPYDREVIHRDELVVVP